MNMANHTSLDIIRHSLAHIMAAAVLELWPNTKISIGPVIENGFYYDFDFDADSCGTDAEQRGIVISENDLPKIEKRMKKLISQNIKFEKKLISKAEAKKMFADQPYKLELIEELPEEKVTIYRSGNFVDLCRGPHVQSIKEIPADGFKLTKIAGAYWRGDEKNKQLTRIYGLAFENGKKLAEYLKLLEEAKKRDHRILGQELDLFIMSSIVGSGLPIFTPKGTILRETLESFLRDEQIKRNYLPVWSPHLGKVELYEKSGHWPYYKETMYPPLQIDEEQYILKPMNCPHHIQIYQSKLRSYRDLPLRLAEFGTVYRYEKSGELTGLTRVRGLTIDDAHLFCREDQVENEVIGVIELTQSVLKSLGLKNVEARLSLWDPKNKKKYAGNEKLWNKAQGDLRKALEKKKMKFTEAGGEAAFYGPKIDFMVHDILGREWQMGTIQLDYNLPERFELEYIGQDGKKHKPIMIHRAPFGSIERFLAILIEHYAGAFPVWLSPVQVIILPVGKAHIEPAQKLKEELEAEGIRIELNADNDTIGYKIRQAEKQKIPYMLVIGDKEAKSNNLNVRLRGQKEVKTIPRKKFIENIKDAIIKKSNH